MRLPGTEPTNNEPVIEKPDTPEQPDADAPKKPGISIDPIKIVFMVLNKWPIIFLTATVFTFVAYLYAKSSDYIYRAAARVEVFHEERFKDSSSQTGYYDALERHASRHMIIMRGEMFHKELINKLRVKWSGKIPENELEVPFKIESVWGSGFSRHAQTMIDLSVDSKYPDYALDYLQGILGSYRNFRERELSQINENALAGLRSEEARIQAELTHVRSEIAQFELENKVTVAQEREKMQDEVVDDLIGRLQMIRTERLLLEHQYEEIADSDLVTISETISMNQNPQIREFLLSQKDLQGSKENNNSGGISSELSNNQKNTSWEEQEEKLILLENEYQRQLTVFKPEHPKMKELKAQIDAINSNLERQLEVALNRFQASYKALRRKEEAIEKVIENMQNEKILSPEKESEYLRLKKQESQLKEKYDMIYKRLLANAGSNDTFSFITIQEPYILENPVAPAKLKILAIGPIFGIFISVAFILLKSFIIPTFFPILKEYREKYKNV
jgi:uncharacterized protein involved in exopolysaccharide biosynthesis